MNLLSLVVDLEVFRLEVGDRAALFVEGDERNVDEAGGEAEGDGRIIPGLGESGGFGKTCCRSYCDLRDVRLWRWHRRRGDFGYCGRLRGC